VGVAQRRRRARLAQEAVHDFLVVDFLANHFDRDLPVQLGVAAQIHRTHAARANLPENFEGADLCGDAGHGQIASTRTVVALSGPPFALASAITALQTSSSDRPFGVTRDVISLSVRTPWMPSEQMTSRSPDLISSSRTSTAMPAWPDTASVATLPSRAMSACARVARVRFAARIATCRRLASTERRASMPAGHVFSESPAVSRMKDVTASAIVADASSPPACPPMPSTTAKNPRSPSATKRSSLRCRTRPVSVAAPKRNCIEAGYKGEGGRGKGLGSEM